MEVQTNGESAAPEEFNEAGLELSQAYALEGWRGLAFQDELRERTSSDEYGPIFRQIRDMMKAQGARNDLRKKKGTSDKGFRRWLAEYKIPHTRIYQWIKKDEIRNGDRNPPKPKTPALAPNTSYRSVRRSAAAEPEPEPEVKDGQGAASASDKPLTK